MAQPTILMMVPQIDDKFRSGEVPSTELGTCLSTELKRAARYDLLIGSDWHEAAKREVPPPTHSRGSLAKV